MIAALCLAALLLALGADEFEEHLRALSSPHAHERAAAERWLSAHLELERYPELAEAALGGDAEVRQRLIHALGSDERHLGIALRFLDETDPLLVALGEDALHAAVARFDPELGQLGLRGTSLDRRLARLAAEGPPRIYQVDPAKPLERTLEALELFGDLPVGLTVDPRIAARVSRRDTGPIVGPWDRVLLELARTLGVAIEGHGLKLDDEEGEVRGGFLHVTPDLEGAARPGAEIEAAWMRSLAADADAETRARAARNLASARFVPALHWMETLLASESAAAPALEGLLRSTALGGAARELLEPARFVATLDRALAGAPERSAAPRLVALARAGCVSAGGAPLAPRFLDGYDELGARGRWGRLLLLEHLGCADPVSIGRARATLGAASEPPVLRRQALAALAALAPERSTDPPAVPEALELFRDPLSRAELVRLARGLAILGIEPPGRDVRSLPAGIGVGVRRALLRAWLWNGDAAVAAAHLSALVAADPSLCTGESLLPELEPSLARGEAARVRGLLDAARGPAASPCLERLALLCGLLDGKAVDALLARNPALASEADPVALGAVAAQKGALVASRTARETLLLALSKALETDRKPADSAALLRGLELGAAGLFAERRDQEGTGLVEQVRRLLRGFPKTELARYFERLPWTLAPGVEVLDLEADGFGPFEVPPTL